jgi:hypothetical protein
MIEVTIRCTDTGLRLVYSCTSHVDILERVTDGALILLPQDQQRWDLVIHSDEAQ